MGLVGKVGDWVASAVRLLNILLVAITLGLLYLFGSVRRWFITDPTRRRAHRRRQRGRLLRVGFMALGGSFIKVGQVLSTRADLLSPECIDELRALQDRVPAFSWRRVQQTVRLALGADETTVFAQFSHRPIAAGSIAQVHRAMLHDGRVVAVKVRRPDIDARVRRDARICLWLAHVAHAVSAKARAWRLGETMRSFSAVTMTVGVSKSP